MRLTCTVCVVLLSLVSITSGAGNKVFYITDGGLSWVPLDDGSSPELVATIPGGCTNGRGLAVDHNWKVAILTCGASVYEIRYENTPATVKDISLQGGEGTAKHSVTMTNRGVAYISQYSATEKEWQVLAYDFLGCARHARGDTCLDGCKFDNNRCKDNNVYGYNVKSADGGAHSICFVDGILFLSSGKNIVIPKDTNDPTSNKITVVSDKKFPVKGIHKGSSGNIIFSNTGNEIWRSSAGLTKVLKVGVMSPSADSGASNFWYFNDADVLVAAEGIKLTKYDCASEPCFDVMMPFVTAANPITQVTAWFTREKEIIPEKDFLPTEKPAFLPTAAPTSVPIETPSPSGSPLATSGNTTTAPTAPAAKDGVNLVVVVIIAVVASVLVLGIAAGCFFVYRSKHKKQKNADIERSIREELQKHPTIVDESARKSTGREVHSNPLLSLPECGDVHHDNNSSDDALSIITAINTVNTANVTSLNSRTPKTPRTPHTPRSAQWPSTPTAPPKRRGTHIRGVSPEPHAYPSHSRRTRGLTRTLPPSNYARQTM